MSFELFINEILFYIDIDKIKGKSELIDIVYNNYKNDIYSDNNKLEILNHEGKLIDKRKINIILDFLHYDKYEELYFDNLVEDYIISKIFIIKELSEIIIKKIIKYCQENCSYKEALDYFDSLNIDIKSDYGGLQIFYYDNIIGNIVGVTKYVSFNPVKSSEFIISDEKYKKNKKKYRDGISRKAPICKKWFLNIYEEKYSRCYKPIMCNILKNMLLILSKKNIILAEKLMDRKLNLYKCLIFLYNGYDKFESDGIKKDKYENYIIGDEPHNYFEEEDVYSDNSDENKYHEDGTKKELCYKIEFCDDIISYENFCLLDDPRLLKYTKIPDQDTYRHLLYKYPEYEKIIENKKYNGYSTKYIENGFNAPLK